MKSETKRVLARSFLLLLPVAAPLFTACSTSADQTSKKWTPEIRPGLIMVTPDQAELHGIALKTPSGPPPKEAKGLDSSAVLNSPAIHAYTVGRYQDPADPDLLHEAHLVYRKESSASWRLDVEPGKQILVGPMATDRNPNAGPIQEKELTQFLTEMARANRENRQAIEMLYKALEALSAQQKQIQPGTAQPQPIPTAPSEKS